MKILQMMLLCLILLAAACKPITRDAASVAPAEVAPARLAQIATLQALLQDPDFALEIAAWLDAAYYKGQGQAVPAFLSAEEETAVQEKSVKEEKIAMNLAGFYAVEAGLGVLVERTGETPFALLTAIVDQSLPAADMLLLARFANATWKAGQPFRALDRITRDTFVPASMLTDEDLQKDFDQISAAAEILVERMQGVAEAEPAAQLTELQRLLQEPAFALEMAQWLDAAYYKGQGQAVPAFLSAEEETAVKEKPLKEEKIAMNLAGFYAVEAGLGVLVERSDATPVEILTAIVDGSLPQEDMLLLARFANATWKAGQPFRALDRITRDSFIPAALLSDEELQKDFVQITAAAEKLLEKLK